MSYLINCTNNHKMNVSASILEQVLFFNFCLKCNQIITDVKPEKINIKCPCCGLNKIVSWKKVREYLRKDCPNCRKENSEVSLHIENSFQFKTELYEHYANIVNTKPYKKRPDYWEILTHFCKREELIQILNSGCIKSYRTGLCNKKAVCLTETPIAYTSNIRSKHGQFGIAFRKKQLILNGGQPIINLTTNLISAQESKGGFSEKIKPFLQLLEIPEISNSDNNPKKVDFLHEREWRIGSDIDFDKIKPLGIVLPSSSSIEKKFTGENWGTLFNAAFAYGEIQ